MTLSNIKKTPQKKAQESHRPFPLITKMPKLIKKEFFDKMRAYPQVEVRAMIKTLLDHYIDIHSLYNEIYMAYTKAMVAYFDLRDDYDEDFDTMVNFLFQVKTVPETLLNIPSERYLFS